MNKTKEEIQMEQFQPVDLMELLYAFRRRWKILVTAMILGGIIAGIYTRIMITPLYTSTATILVLSKETTLTSIADLQFGTQLTSDYTALVRSRPVMEEVIENLGLDMGWSGLKGSIQVVNPSGTRLLELTVTNGDPELAKRIVDELANVSAAYVADQMEVIPPKIIEDGIVSNVPVSPNMKSNVIKGMLGGLAIVAVLTALFAMLDDTIKSEEELERYLKIPTLASVPDRKDYVSSHEKHSGRRKRREKK